MTRVLVCGDRRWTDERTILAKLKGLGRAVVIHGGASGADRLAGFAAAALGLVVHVYPANWEKHGKAAGPIRNRQMLDTKPDLVLAFHDDLAHSKGTKDCVEEARRRGIPVEIITGRDSTTTVETDSTTRRLAFPKASLPGASLLDDLSGPCLVLWRDDPRCPIERPRRSDGAHVCVVDVDETDGHDHRCGCGAAWASWARRRPRSGA